VSPARVLVTGADGFVGRALTAGFARLGWDVVGLDREAPDAPAPERAARGDARDEPAGAEGHPAGRIRWIEADLVEPPLSDVPPVDLVVHAAWVTTDPRTLGISVADYIALNLRPVLTVLAYVARVRPRAFVFLSSSGVFASADATDGLTDEHLPTGRSPYAVAKRAAELMVPSAVEPPTAAHVVRLGYLFGPGETARPSRTNLSPIGGWLAAASAGRPLEVRSDDPLRDWTFTPDLAAALARVAGSAPTGGPIHLGSGQARRDRAVAGEIATAVGGVELVSVPAGHPMKPPMIPSDVPALRGFRWTDPLAGLRALVASERAA
jgi:UDP-glucose 4-epimerase